MSNCLSLLVIKLKNKYFLGNFPRQVNTIERHDMYCMYCAHGLSSS